jgi:predicted transcriptional regulator
VHFTPELEARLTLSAEQQGRNTDELVQEVLAQYLADEARFSMTVENWSDEDWRAAAADIEEGFLQSERGELVDGDEARREIDALKRK